MFATDKDPQRWSKVAVAAVFCGSILWLVAHNPTPCVGGAFFISGMSFERHRSTLLWLESNGVANYEHVPSVNVSFADFSAAQGRGWLGTRGELGCRLAHIEALTRVVLSARTGWFLIVEDDVSGDYGAAVSALAGLIKYAPFAEGLDLYSTHGRLPRPWMMPCTTAYWVTQTGAARFLRFAGRHPSVQIDMVHNPMVACTVREWLEHILMRFWTFPKILRPGPIPSLIG